MSDERTVYVANFGEQINEELLEELFTQAGPVVKVILRDVRDSTSKFALVEFEDEVSVLFAIEVMDGVKLHGVPIQVKPRNGTNQETLYRKKRGEIMERQRSVPSTPSADRRDRRDRNGSSSGNRDSWRQNERDGGGWRNDRNPYSTPQLLPHQQFVHHMMHQLPYSAPSYHGGGGGGGGHYPRQDYQTPQRRQGYSRDGPGGGRRGSQRSGRY